MAVAYGVREEVDVPIRLLMGVLVTASLALGAAGCTPSETTAPAPSSLTSSSVTGSPTASVAPTQTPTPTQALDANQTAAVEAVRGYTAASARIAADPAALTKAEMTSLLKRYGGGDMADPSWFVGMAKKGFRQKGEVRPVSTTATESVDNHSGRGLEVHVTVCQDQTALQVVNKAGDVVAAEQPAPFNLRQYSVRKPPTETRWRVYGVMTVEGECGK